MQKRRNVTHVVALAASLLIPLITGANPARGDEPADLHVNQELLQSRIDQLAQSGNPGAGSVLSPTTGGPVNVQMTGGSFPRSFLIPGTDTSIRVGGEIRMLTVFWINGGNPNGSEATTNAGTTGQLNNIPLSGLRPGSTGAIARERSDNVLNMSPQQSKLSIETRTPSAWGEARTFLEFDFAGDTTSSARPMSAANSLQPRVRYAYGAIGPLLFGQANSNFNDSDAGMESLQFGGLIGGGGPARVPQLRWTQPLGEWGLLGALSVSAEAPETEIFATGASGIFGAGPTTAVNLAAPTLAGSGAAGAAACQVTLAQFTAGTCNVTVANPLKNSAPELVAAWYIPQPWGHVDFATVLRPDLRVQQPFGAGVDRTYIGFGGSFSGDVKPRWFGWDKDFITWNAVGGQAMGRYLYASGTASSVGLVSNLSGNTLVNNAVLIKPTSGWSGNMSYQHHWTTTVRSNIGVGVWHLDIPGLNNQVCPGSSRATAAGGCNLNKNLYEGQVNVIWAPIAFADFGLEYTFGQRQVVSGQRGNENVITSRFRLRF